MRDNNRSRAAMRRLLHGTVNLLLTSGLSAAASKPSRNLSGLTDMLALRPLIPHTLDARLLERMLAFRAALCRRTHRSDRPYRTPTAPVVAIEVVPGYRPIG
ncbi:hypothetical protein [Candidatus Burkholderia verschuerenii]|uniref:hypothetical protein n=1 Tax=Candidatus Burkholderia verschuerenii TaxID=242163 RepID=UPI001E45B169|nr:hypothetical protein [Candidatus Burkholderia verschuerenii]